MSTSVTTSTSFGSTPSASATTCAITVRWPCPCGVVAVRTVIPPSAEIVIVHPSAFPDLGRPRVLGRLGQRDVAHVRDRRLHDASDPDADEAVVRARSLSLSAALVVARERERVVEAALVIAGVVERARRRPVRELLASDEIAPPKLGRVDPEPVRRDRHRPLECEIELRAAEASVEAARHGVREDDAIPCRDVPHAVRTRERAVHSVERRRLGRAHVRADVLDRVVPERDELAVGGEARLDMRDASARGRARGEVLEAVFDPANGNAELARREAHQHDVGEDGRLDPERAARVRWRDQAELRAGQSECRGGDRVQRERALEVRPGGQ